MAMLITRSTINSSIKSLWHTTINRSPFRQRVQHFFLASFYFLIFEEEQEKYFCWIKREFIIFWVSINLANLAVMIERLSNYESLLKVNILGWVNIKCLWNFLLITFIKYVQSEVGKASGCIIRLMFSWCKLS